jgi:hypothetical protein
MAGTRRAWWLVDTAMHRQRQGLDFEETYASVGSYRTMRMIKALTAHEDLEHS